jgi:4-hydroxybenzoyl-CoA reductase subunit beta
MIRLPVFAFRQPRSVSEVTNILADEGPSAMVLAGGTDLVPKIKRRQMMPRTLVSLKSVDGIRTIHHNGAGIRLGSCVTIAEIAQDQRIRNEHGVLWQAACQIATPHIRNVATLGGNLCLDTRCNYYDQSQQWRKAINYCLKKDGDVCWVAPGSSKCLAVSSSDLAPALIALEARVQLVSRSQEREVLVSDLYRNDGISYMSRGPEEIITSVVIDSGVHWRSTYWKLRRRGSIDFSVLSVAAALHLSTDNIVERARIVIGAAASCPLLATEAADALLHRPLDSAAIGIAATAAARISKPLDNTDFDMTWRKKMTAELVKSALGEISQCELGTS